ncbi:helix-turn-helix domain-containing protein [Cohnella soli]|uniref:Helix-turn-helix domain-containing protein n=1 Tax=Cohnella soli TaxID=425005 RepID=A0ABW0HRD2_9BACL
MHTYPVHDDVFAYFKLKKNQVPFYILEQTITESTDLHHHDFVEFSFVLQGKALENIDGKTYEMTPGTARILPPNQIHAIEVDPQNPLHLYCCMFDFYLLLESPFDDQLAKSILQAGDTLPYYTKLDGSSYEEMHRLCKKIKRECTASYVGRNSAIRAALLEILLVYVRSFANQDLTEQSLHTETSNHIEWNIIHFVNKHFFQPLTIKDLSERFGVSSSYISKLFKRQLNTYFVDYLHALRIRRAKSLLLSTDMHIYEISVESGFDSFRTFSRLFKQATLLTPRDFRNARCIP